VRGSSAAFGGFTRNAFRIASKQRRDERAATHPAFVAADFTFGEASGARTEGSGPPPFVVDWGRTGEKLGTRHTGNETWRVGLTIAEGRLSTVRANSSDPTLFHDGWLESITRGEPSM
jgi:hypothetical protein